MITPHEAYVLGGAFGTTALWVADRLGVGVQVAWALTCVGVGGLLAGVL